MIVSCTNTPVVSKADKETEDKFMYIAKLYIEEEKKLLDSVKFVVQQDIITELPDECYKYLHDTNGAIAKEFYNRTYPKHLEEFRNSIASLSNHTVIAFSNVYLACSQSRIYRLSGKVEDLEKVYDYKRQISEETDKADEIVLHIEEFLNTQ